MVDRDVRSLTTDQILEWVADPTLADRANNRQILTTELARRLESVGLKLAN